MKQLIFEKCLDYNDLSQKCCDSIIACIQNNPSAVICLATGSSPTGGYKFFVEYVKAKNIDISGVTFVKLDEWLGVPASHPCTCESYLQEHIIEPLKLKENNYIAFDNAADPEAECKRVRQCIQQKGGLDLCILGLGKNGHLGLIEPADKLPLHSHRIRLDSKTKTHQMLKDASHLISEGITLGLSEILSADEIVFLVSGENKSAAFDKFCTREISTTLPCSFLWLHQNVRCLYDAQLFQPGPCANPTP